VNASRLTTFALLIKQDFIDKTLNYLYI